MGIIQGQEEKGQKQAEEWDCAAVTKRQVI